MEAVTQSKNRLGEEKIAKLLLGFAIPSIVAMLVSSLYNMVDQFFIGRTIGELGNAATNIQFPLTTACVASALLCGIGGASAINLAMGKSKFDPSEKEHASDYLGNAIVMILIIGTGLLLITQIFLEPLLHFFGSPADVLPYAKSYTRIVSFGFPFLILSTGGGHLLRADGRPRATMTCNLVGAVINTVLDAVFLLVFDWGMEGAALATVIGQVIAAGLVTNFLRHTKNVALHRANFRLRADNARHIASLGTAQCINQIAMMIVQIVMNNSLRYYGARSVYGESIPIAVVGIITKVNMIYMAFNIGLSQGLQPIVGYNYGARRYDRVKKACLLAMGFGAIVSCTAFALFQLQPRAIISIFGNGSEEYFAFAVQYFRIFLFFTFANFVQPIASNTYTAIGKPIGGTIMSLTRQILFLLPLLLILPLFMGIDGILYAGPIADGLALIVSTTLFARELTRKEYR